MHNNIKDSYIIHKDHPAIRANILNDISDNSTNLQSMHVSIVATRAFISYCTHCIVGASDVLCATNRECFPKRLCLRRYMSAINRQASGFSSKKEEGARRRISTDTLERAETAFKFDIQVSRRMWDGLLAVFLRQRSSYIYQYSSTNTMYTVSHQYLREIRFSCKIISTLSYYSFQIQNTISIYLFLHTL